MFLGVTGMILCMPYTDDELRTIASAVRRARIAQKLDKEPAARAADVSSITWKRVEDSESVRDASLGKILDSLGLESADHVLGRAERPAPTPPRIVLLSQVPTLELVDEIRRRVVSGLDHAAEEWPFGDGLGQSDAGGAAATP